MSERVDKAIAELETSMNEELADVYAQIPQAKAAITSAIEGLRMAVSLFSMAKTTPTAPPAPTITPLTQTYGDTSTPVYDNTATHDATGPGDG